MLLSKVLLPVKSLDVVEADCDGSAFLFVLGKKIRPRFIVISPLSVTHNQEETLVQP